MSVSARGRAPAAAKVAKVRAKTTLNCIFLFFSGGRRETLALSTKKVAKPSDLFILPLGGHTARVTKSLV